jgi:peptide/nickel transport system permease protein
MTRFVTVRLIRALLTLLLVFTFTFFALRAGTDVANQVLNWQGSKEAVAAFNERWGLDRPLIEQYVSTLAAMASGDFGYSFRDGRPAIDWVAERLPRTVLLTGSALALTVLIGIPAGILAALNRGRLIDRATMTLATIGYSLPSFVYGLALIYLFAVFLQVLPSSGYGDASQMVMPVTVAGTIGAAALARFTRSAMLDVLGQPYILAARAGGVPSAELIFRHALPNAAIPIVTYLGFAVGALVGGAIVIETVFAWPGLGAALSEAVGSSDLTIVQTMVLLFAAIMVAANFAVDVAYGFLNPKIRLVAHDD